MKKSLISTEAFGTGLAVVISQVMPPFIGYPVARFIAWIISLFPNGSAYRSLKLNHWIASGKTLGERELRKRVRLVMRNQGQGLYDFYRTLNRPELVRRLVSFTPRFEKLIEELKSGNQPTLLLMPHISGFNLGGLRLQQEGLRFLTLAYPNPSRGYKWQNKLRNDRGMEVVPFSFSSYVLARQRLQQGGIVLTAVDRPLEGSGYRPKFFGFPADLPVAYARLAVKTSAQVFVLGFTTNRDHSQVVDVSERVEMEHHSDADQELVLNAEKVLRVAEAFIQKDPEQWMMFYPVWPDELKNLEQYTRSGK